MHYDPRHLASLMIAAAAGIVAPMPASADSAAPQAIELAQELPPPIEAAPPVDAPAPPAVEKRKRREEQPPAEPPAERQRIERSQDDEQPRRERQQERARQQQDQDQQRIERQQEAERVREERAQEKARQDQLQSQERAQREAERAEKQEAERVREERVQEKARQDQLQSQERAQREAEQAKKQEADRVREERKPEPAPAVAAPQAPVPGGSGVQPVPANDRQQQRQDERRGRDAERAAPRDDERRRLREQAPPVATQPVPVPVPPPNGAGVQPVPANDRQQQRQDERRGRDAERAVPRDDERRRLRERAPAVASPPTAATGVQPQQPPARVGQPGRVGSPARDNIRESYRRAPKQQRSFDDLKRNRRERTISPITQGNLRVIEEPDRRVIVKQNNRTFIRHDESERFRRIAPDARTIKRADGTSTTFMTRSGGVRIYDVSDRNGRLLHRYRRYPNGREVILIDNRGHYRRDKSRTRDVLIGAGIGLFIGSAIALAAPKVRIPRDEYIVDYGRASDDDLYEALTAPPIERLDRGYSLDEVRYSSNLRDRMRRIDLDTVTFDFGSWEVGPDQGRALDRLADGINRVLQRNPDEIFMIEGHTDAVGTQDDNLTLSDRRAQSVAEILTTEYGVAPENLVTQGYGEEQLKIPTDGPERLNRRITVRRIGPLLSGQFEEERYSGAAPTNDRIDDGDRGYEDLDDGPPDDGLPAVVPPDDGRTYDYENDRYR